MTNHAECERNFHGAHFTGLSENIAILATKKRETRRAGTRHYGGPSKRLRYNRGSDAFSASDPFKAIPA
jgi:hypothetical protein